MKLGNKKQLTGFALFSLLSAILAGKMLVEFGTLTNLAITKNYDLLVQTGIVIGIIGVVQMLVWTLRNRFAKQYMKASMISLRETYVEELLKRHKLTENHAQYVSHLTNDADRLEQQYFLNLTEFVNLITTVMVSMYILGAITWIFLVVIAVLAVVFYLMARKTSEPIKKEEKVKSKELERYTHFIEETLDGYAVIKSHQYEPKRLSQFQELINALRKRQFQLEKKLSMVDALNGVVQGVVIATLSVIGMSIAKKAGFGLGETMVIVLIFSDILWPLQRLTPLINEMTSIQTVFESYDTVLNASDAQGNKQAQPFESLKFTNASLGYDTPILSDVNLEVTQNEKVLIVGPSGAGKSTVLRTLLRDIEPLGGGVNLNDTRLDAYTLESFNANFSVVDQIGFIFSGTIQENISLLENKDVTEHLKMVNLENHDPQQILKNNGDTLSGGERARILLARSLYFLKEVIVCDEILSSLDAQVARSIEYDILTNSQTLINVSHIVFKDNLQYYDKFVIVEDGGLSVSRDPKYVLDRMLQSDVIIQ